MTILRRLGLISLLGLAVTAFSADDRKALAKACANSLIKGKERGQPIPQDLVSNRKAICACIARQVGADATIRDQDKQKITKIYEFSAAGDMKSATAIVVQMASASNIAIRTHTRACSRYFQRPMKKKDRGGTPEGKKAP